MGIVNYEDLEPAAWYSSGEALELIRKFHYSFARQPPEMRVARLRHIEIMEELVSYLKWERNILKRAEYTGSAYEGLKVGGKELEFDVMLVLNHGELLKVEKDHDCTLYGHLMPKVYFTHKFKGLLEYGKLSPFLIRYWFHGELQKWINEREADDLNLYGEIKLRYNGCAIRISVCRNDEHWYFVDLVPAYEVIHQGQREIYVAKPKGDDDILWRHSFSLEEKAKLQNIDGPDNGCRKKVIRILKVLRDREPGLNKMVSFFIKCKVIEMSDLLSLDWSEKRLAERLGDVMLRICRSMKQGTLRHPFKRSVNLLHGLSLETSVNIADRLRRLATKERVAKRKFGGIRVVLESLRPSNYDDSDSDDSDSDWSSWNYAKPIGRGSVELKGNCDRDNNSCKGFCSICYEIITTFIYIYFFISVSILFLLTWGKIKETSLGSPE